MLIVRWTATKSANCWTDPCLRGHLEQSGRYWRSSRAHWFMPSVHCMPRWNMPRRDCHCAAWMRPYLPQPVHQGLAEHGQLSHKILVLHFLIFDSFTTLTTHSHFYMFVKFQWYRTYLFLVNLSVWFSYMM